MTMTIPTVDDWFQLARRYPQYKTVTNSTLKDYGYLACLAFIEDMFGARGKDVRLLEFGHGFNPQILEHFQHKHEVWGADRDQQLAYFKNRDWETDFAEKVAPRCPDVHFVRELLSTSTSSDLIPDNAFDCILSVSVLEEVPIPVVQDVLKAAAAKLKPGGWLIGTHDIGMANPSARASQYVDAHRAAGLDLGELPQHFNMDWRQILLENPLAVMLWYQQATPEEQRRYWGHFATLWTIARKL